jgi:hypothetical protein
MEQRRIRKNKKTIQMITINQLDELRALLNDLEIEITAIMPNYEEIKIFRVLIKEKIENMF